MTRRGAPSTARVLAARASGRLRIEPGGQFFFAPVAICRTSPQAARARRRRRLRATGVVRGGTRAVIDVHTHLHPPRLFAAIRRWFAERSPWVLEHPTEPHEVARVLREHGVETVRVLLVRAQARDGARAQRLAHRDRARARRRRRAAGDRASRRSRSRRRRARRAARRLRGLESARGRAALRPRRSALRAGARRGRRARRLRARARRPRSRGRTIPTTVRRASPRVLDAASGAARSSSRISARRIICAISP